MITIQGSRALQKHAEKYTATSHGNKYTFIVSMQVYVYIHVCSAIDAEKSLKIRLVEKNIMDSFQRIIEL